jgi:hypothetical protein
MNKQITSKELTLETINKEIIPFPSRLTGRRSNPIYQTIIDKTKQLESNQALKISGLMPNNLYTLRVYCKKNNLKLIVRNLNTKEKSVDVYIVKL